MKIALVLHQFPPRYTTGTELYAFRLAGALVRLGVDVVVFTGEDCGEATVAIDEYVVDGLPVTRAARQLSVESDPILGGYASSITEAAFARFLDRECPDVVHVFHLQGLGGRLLDATEVRGIPLFVHLMDYWFLCPRTQMFDFEGELCPGPTDAARCARCAGEVDGDYAHVAALADDDAAVRSRELQVIADRWPFLRDRLSRAAGVISPSEDLRTRFVENGLAADRIDVIRYGIDPPSAPGRRTRAPGEPFRFGFIGNLATFKGAHVLLDAFCGWDDERVELRLHGDFFFREPEHEARCRAWIDADPRIDHAGRFDSTELERVLAGIDALVVPSLWYENTPFVVLEALCARVPVVASRIDGIAEAVEEGVDGLLFTRGDPESLRDAMRSMAAEPDRFAPPARPVPTTEDNVEELLRRYQAATAIAIEPSAEAQLQAARDANARLFDALEALANLAGGRDRGGLRRLRGAADVERELEGYKRKAAELEADRNRLQRGVAKVEANLRAERETVERAFERYRADASQERDTFLRDLHGHRATIETLGADVVALRDHVAHLERENENLVAHGATLSRDLDGHRAALETSSRREAEARAAAETAQQSAERLERDHDTLQTTIRERDEALDRVQRLYDDLRLLAEDERRGLASARKRIAELERVLDSSAFGPNL